LAVRSLVIGGILLSFSGEAIADCADRSIVLEGSSGTIVCSGNTSDSTNRLDPGAPGCVEAFGSSVATPGPDLDYAVIMPPGSVMDVLVTPSPPWDAAVYATTSIDPAELPDSCFAGVDAAFNAGQEILSDVRNERLEPDTIYVVVDSATPTGPVSRGPFTIEFRYTFGTSVGDACTGTGPIVVAWTGDTFSFSGNSCGAADDFRLTSGECASALEDSLRGRDLVFEVTVPDSSEWQATVTPGSSWDPALLVTATCSASASCLDAVDAGRAGDPETTRPITALEGDGTSTTHYLILDSGVAPGGSGGCGPFTLLLTKRRTTAGAGESCADPTPVTLTGSGLVELEGWNCGRVNDVVADGTECGTVFNPLTNGPDVVYAVRLQQELRWAVQVQPHGEFDVNLFVATDCFQYTTTCIAGADRWGSGKGEEIEGLTGTAEQVFYVFVDTTAETPCGGYDLFLRGTPTTPVSRTSWSALKSRYLPGDAR